MIPNSDADCDPDTDADREASPLLLPHCGRSLHNKTIRTLSLSNLAIQRNAPVQVALTGDSPSVAIQRAETALIYRLELSQNVKQLGNDIDNLGSIQYWLIRVCSRIRHCALTPTFCVPSSLCHYRQTNTKPLLKLRANHAGNRYHVSDIPREATWHKKAR
jgi:ethanolamine ammonia-lyase small subunit